MLVAELPVAGVVVVPGFGAAVLGVAAGLAGAVEAGTPEAEAASGVVVVVAPLAETGSVVSGVGSPGIGFDRMPAINSFKPVCDLLRYVYHLVSSSIQIFLFACSAGSLPASATARA